MAKLIINNEIYKDKEGNDIEFDKIAKSKGEVYGYVGGICVVHFCGINESLFETSDGKWQSQATLRDEVNDINLILADIMEGRL